MDLTRRYFPCIALFCSEHNYTPQLGVMCYFRSYLDAPATRRFNKQLLNGLLYRNWTTAVKNKHDAQTPVDVVTWSIIEQGEWIKYILCWCKDVPYIFSVAVTVCIIHLHLRKNGVRTRYSRFLGNSFNLQLGNYLCCWL